LKTLSNYGVDPPLLRSPQPKHDRDHTDAADLTDSEGMKISIEVPSLD